MVKFVGMVMGMVLVDVQLDGVVTLSWSLSLSPSSRSHITVHVTVVVDVAVVVHVEASPVVVAVVDVVAWIKRIMSVGGMIRDVMRRHLCEKVCVRRCVVGRERKM